MHYFSNRCNYATVLKGNGKSERKDSINNNNNSNNNNIIVR